MTSVGPFWLALASGVAHAAWNALAKTPGRERAATLAALLVSLFVAASVALAADGALPTRAGPWVLLAGGGEALYVFALGQAYARGALGLTYAVSRASALVFIWPCSALAFGTTPGALALTATATVALGLFFTRPKETERPALHLGWTLVTGAAVALYHTGYKGAVDAGGAPVFAFCGAVALAIPLLLVLVGREVRRQVPALLVRPRLLVAGVLCAGSFLLMLEALATSESGRILGVRNASVGFGVVFAVLLGERPTRRQWLGLFVLFAGVALFGVERPGR